MLASVQESRFVWNPGGWFGAQFGCTVWMFVLGGATVPIDLLAGIVAFASFAAGNLWGLSLWRRRAHVSAYSGKQWMMVGLVPVYAAAVLTTNARVPAFEVPYWAIAVPLALMAVSWLVQHGARCSTPEA